MHRQGCLWATRAGSGLAPGERLGEPLAGQLSGNPYLSLLTSLPCLPHPVHLPARSVLLPLGSRILVSPQDLGLPAPADPAALPSGQAFFGIFLIGSGSGLLLPLSISVFPTPCQSICLLGEAAGDQ